MSSKVKSKTVIKISDTYISLLTLKKNNHGFFVDYHEKIKLPKQMIHRGEILNIDALLTIFIRMKKNIDNKHVDVLFSHDYFLLSDCTLDPINKKKNLKKRIREYFKSLNISESWHKTHVCEFTKHQLKEDEKVIFHCLPKDLYESYTHLFKKAGFIVSSMNSDILCFDHVLGKERVSLIVISDENIRVAEFRDGVYFSHKIFQASSNQCIQEIAKHINVSFEEASKIFDKYGVLRLHKDAKVYKNLIRSLSTLTEFISKRKIKEKSHISVIFESGFIPGFVDLIKKSTPKNVFSFNVLTMSKFNFHDILSLHQKDSYHYQGHIAQALKEWNYDN